MGLISKLYDLVLRMCVFALCAKYMTLMRETSGFFSECIQTTDKRILMEFSVQSSVISDLFLETNFYHDRYSSDSKAQVAFLCALTSHVVILSCFWSVNILIWIKLSK